MILCFFFFFSSSRRHTTFSRDWSSDVCSSDLCGGRLRRHDHSGREGNLGNRADFSHVVPGLAETTRRNPDFFFVVKRNAFAHHLVDLFGGCIVPDRKEELLGRRAGHRHHRHFPLPRLTQPSFAGEFLNPPGTLAFRVTPIEHEQEVSGDEQDNPDQYREDFHGLLPSRMLHVKPPSAAKEPRTSHKRCSTHPLTDCKAPASFDASLPP